MGHFQFDDASRERAAWNSGKKVGTKRPLTQKQISAVRFFLDRERRIRENLLQSFDCPLLDILTQRIERWRKGRTGQQLHLVRPH